MENKRRAVPGPAGPIHNKFLNLAEVYTGSDIKVMRATTILGKGYLITTKEDDVWGQDPSDYKMYDDWADTVMALKDRKVCLEAVQEADLFALDR
jgi:hypothetical protein